jgi:hypothetical protein
MRQRRDALATERFTVPVACFAPLNAAPWQLRLFGEEALPWYEITLPATTADEELTRIQGLFPETIVKRETAIVADHVLTGGEIEALSPAEDGDEVAIVKASDLLHKVQVLGNLGKPIGKIVTVRGTWHGPGQRKSADRRFVVSHIDGQPAQEVEFTEHEVRHVLSGGRPTEDTEKWDWVAKGKGVIKTDPPKAVVGETWELQAFETAKVTGYPATVWEAYGEDELPVQRSGERYELTPELRYIKLRRIPQAK